MPIKGSHFARRGRVALLDLMADARLHLSANEVCAKPLRL
jgi:hypothetical protein